MQRIIRRKLFHLSYKKITNVYIGLIFIVLNSSGQGINNLWLVGYQSGLDTHTTSKRATLDFQSGTLNIIPTNSKMRFDETEGDRKSVV